MRPRWKCFIDKKKHFFRIERERSPGRIKRWHCERTRLGIDSDENEKWEIDNIPNNSATDRTLVNFNLWFCCVDKNAMKWNDGIVPVWVICTFEMINAGSPHNYTKCVVLLNFPSIFVRPATRPTRSDRNFIDYGQAVAFHYLFDGLLNCIRASHVRLSSAIIKANGNFSECDRATWAAANPRQSILCWVYKYVDYDSEWKNWDN